MIYVASPYSSPIPELVDYRYNAVCDFVDKLLAQDFVAFSPIVYCHPIAARIGKATDAMTWHNFNMNMLRRAEACFLLCLPGWEASKGVLHERKVCQVLDIPIIHYGADFQLRDDCWMGHVPASF